MRADGLAFAVRVGREVDVFYFLRRLFQLGDELFLTFDDLIARFEAVIDVDREVLLGEIFDMTEGSFDYKLLAQVFVDGLRLSGRFHDYQSFCHRLFLRRTAPRVLGSVSVLTLPHFHKVLARQLLDQPLHFQFEKRGNDFAGRSIFNLFKQIVKMNGCVYFQGFKRPAGHIAQFRTTAVK